MDSVYAQLTGTGQRLCHDATHIQKPGIAAGEHGAVVKVWVLLSGSETWQTRASRGKFGEERKGGQLPLPYKSVNVSRARILLTTALLPIRDLAQRDWLVSFLNSRKWSISLHWLSPQIFQILDNWLMSLKLQRKLGSFTFKQLLLRKHPLWHAGTSCSDNKQPWENLDLRIPVC